MPFEVVMNPAHSDPFSAGELTVKNPPLWTMNDAGRMVYMGRRDPFQDPQLTPGSWWARRRGCTCSPLDNRYGLGTLVPDPELGWEFADTEFTVTPNCPLHDTSASTSENREEGQKANLDSSSEVSPGNH